MQHLHLQFIQTFLGAAVLGNHDQEGSLYMEGVMKHITGMKNTLSKLNPQDYASSIDGFGHNNLEELKTLILKINYSSICFFSIVEITPRFLSFQDLIGSNLLNNFGFK
jgi:hypothetical protein